MPLCRISCLLMLLSVGMAGCAGGVVEGELRASAAAEMARRPAFYTNGEARAWSVWKDGVERGLLWGTFHIAYSGDTVLPSAVRARFYGAADLTVETVLDRVPTEMRALRDRARRANTLADRTALAGLDASTRQALELAVPDAAGRTLSLRGLALLVRSQSRVDGGAVMPNVGFVDLNLIAFARQQNRPVIGLEAPTIVDATLDAPNGAEAAGMLGLELRRAETLAAMGAWVLAAYGRGEVAAAAAVLASWRATPGDLVRYDAEREGLLSRRNAAWVPRLVRRFGMPGDHFVAVGSGHLLGEDGLVALLRARGFQVVACVRDACGGAG